MRILAFVDVHLDEYALHELRDLAGQVDIVVCAGDLSHFGNGLNEMVAFLKSFPKEVLVIPGNNEDPRVLQGLCEEYGLTFINGVSVKRDGYVFAGLGGGLPSRYHTPHELRESEFRTVLDRFRSLKNLILVSHVPPRSHLGEVGPDVNIGSESLLEFIKKEQPLFCVCGHAHEHAGEELIIGRTRVINPGKHGVIIDFKTKH